MKTLLLLPALLLLALPAVARADRYPNFNDDAKPILRLQPGLLEFVETNFKVQETGAARYPGDDDHRPQPPFMFRAKPRGEHGPYHLMLLIQPGPVNHILNIVDMNRVHEGQPVPFSGAAPAPQQQPAPAAPSNAAPSQPTPTLAPASQPTASTPTGPIKPATNSPQATPPPLAPTNP